jgi:hypothetical protein
VRTPFLSLAGPCLLLISAVALPGGDVAHGSDSGLASPPRLTRLGFNGHYKLGRWTPVEVEISPTTSVEAQLVVEAPDPSGSIAAFPSEKRSFAAGTHRLRGLFQNGRLGGEVRVFVRLFSDAGIEAISVANDSGVAAEPLGQGTALVATLGSEAGIPAGDEQSGDEPADSAEADEAARFLARLVPLANADQLPSEPAGYDSLDVLIISGEYALDRATNDALEQWVRGGGHLIVSVGAGTSAYVGSPLAEWVPVEVAPDPQRVRDLSGLETFAGRTQRLEAAQGVPAAWLGEWEGRELVSGGPFGPLLVRVPHGFGAVSFLAVDLNRPPLSQWPGTPSLVRRMIGTGGVQSAAENRPRGRHLTRSGITDLATQLRTAQEKFPRVDRLSLWTVMGLLAAYLLVIGPLDYLLVHRVLKRPRLTWITFPLLVVAATALAVWGAQRTNGERVRVNQIDLVDMDVESQWCRARSWINLYSPDTRRYEAEMAPAEWMPPDDSGDALRMVWYGVPESSYGGMYRPGGFELGRSDYEFSPEATAVQNLPVKIWSTRGLTGQWSRRGAPPVSGALRSTGLGRLSGSISHQLGAPLHDWTLVYGGRAYLPPANRRDGGSDALPPGKELRPDVRNAVPSRELKSYLTGTRAVRVNPGSPTREEILDQETRYDPLNPGKPVDAQATEIVRMISFHEAAGGTGYTGLQNSALGDLDLTELVNDLNRAVLFGRIEIPAGRLVLNGEAVEAGHHSTFVRIVFPVTREAAPTQEINPEQLLEQLNAPRVELEQPTVPALPDEAAR